MALLHNLVFAPVVLSTVIASAAAPCHRAFRSAEPAITSPFISSAVYGDFDEDGRIDVALMLDYDIRIIALNRGGRVFEPRPSETIAHDGSLIALQLVDAADVNHDGHLDLIYRVSNIVCVALGRGDGTFGPLTISQLPSLTGTVVRVVDFNHDGAPDFVDADAGKTFRFVQSKVDGTYGEIAHFTPSNELAQEIVLAAGDFDGDGNLDVVRISTELPSFQTFATFGWNDGHLGFVETKQALDIPHSLRPVDIDGDGAEALVGIDDGSLVIVRVKNRIATVERLPVGTRGVSRLLNNPVMLDMNGDGLPDLVFNSGESMGIVWRTAGGGFRDATYFELAGMTGASPVDLDGDGVIDFAATGGSEGLPVLYGGDLLAGHPGANRVYPLGFAPHSVDLADVDGDGVPDLIARGSDNNTFQAVVVFGDGHGDFRRAATPFSLQSFSQSFVGDFDGDGRTDLAISPNAAGAVKPVLMFGAANGFGESMQLDVDLLVGRVFTGPGATPALVALKGDDVELITVSSGRSVAMTTIYQRPPGANVIAVQAAAGVAAQIAVATGSGMRLVTQASDGWHEGGILTASNVQSIQSADLNADGLQDLISFDTDYQAKLSFGAADGSYTYRISVSGATFLDSVTSVDIDGDGRVDLVTTSRQNFGSPGTLQVLRNTGNPGALFQPYASAQTGAPFALTAAVGDSDGDGQPEVIIPTFDGVEVLANVCATPRVRAAVFPDNPVQGSTARLIVHALYTNALAIGQMFVMQGEKTLTIEQPDPGYDLATGVWTSLPLTAGENTFRVIYNDPYSGPSEISVTIQASPPVPHRRIVGH
jgi:FG-GAP-like repeat